MSTTIVSSPASAALTRAAGSPLDEYHPSPDYHAGRLLAVCQHIQDIAAPDVGHTLVDSYFGSASTYPGQILPRVVQVGRQRLKQIDFSLLRQELDQLVNRIYCQFQEVFTSNLSPYRQGLFQLGFFHQRSCVPRYDNRTRFLSNDGQAVKSYSEKLISDTLHRHGIAYEYEKRIVAPDPKSESGRTEISVDFTVVSPDGERTLYIEYTGAMKAPGYKDQWGYKRGCYERLGVRTKNDVETEGKIPAITMWEIRPEDLRHAAAFRKNLVETVVKLFGDEIIGGCQAMPENVVPF